MCLLLASAAVACAQPAKVPPPARALLDRQHPAWRLAPAAPQITSWFREYGFAFHPSLVRGDFDADGNSDYAVQILEGGKQVVVALMKRGGAFEEHVLARDAANPFRYLLLFEKGSKDIDFEVSLKPFRYPRDAIGLMYFKRTPIIYSWSGGRFVNKRSLGDEEAESERK